MRIFLSTFLAFAMSLSVDASVMVGINFGGTVNPGDAAGVIPAPNWNNFPGFNGSATNLLASTGGASTVSLNYVSDQINGNGPASSGNPGDDALMSNGARFIGERNYTRNNAQFELTGISGTLQDGYDLYVYLGGTSAPFMGGSGNIYLGDPYTPAPINDVPPAPTFTQGFNRPGNVPFGSFAANANYILISGLSGDRQVLTSQIFSGSGGASFDAATIAGLQLVGNEVAVPEASEAALALLAVIGLLTRRVRRRRTT